MASKVCLILVDGLRNDTVRSECGYLMAAVEAGQARIWTMQACLPTISAPLYETIHTGMSPIEHGLLCNEAIRPSPHPNLFSTLTAAGRTTGAVAHSYIHTLYGGTSFDPFEHVEINTPGASIPYARYYSMEGHCRANPTLPSEIDLCAQTWAIARNHAPDYLLLHSSSCDALGHYYTGEGREYRTQAAKVDSALTQLIPRLRSVNYEILVTADHGMNAVGQHGGNEPPVREVPFVVFCDRITAEPGDLLDQRVIAPTILSLLAIEPPKTMKLQPML